MDNSILYGGLLLFVFSAGIAVGFFLREAIDQVRRG